MKEPLLENQQSTKSLGRRGTHKRRKTTEGDIVVNPDKYLKEIEEKEKEDAEAIKQIVLEKSKTINGRLFAYSKQFPCAFCSGILASIVLGMSFPLFALVFAEAITKLNYFSPESQPFAPPNNYDSYKLRCLEFAIIGVGSGLFQFALQYFFSVIGQSVTRDLREKLYDSILRKPVSWFDREGNESGKLNSVLSADTAQLNSVTSQSVGMYIQSLVSIVGGIVFAMVYSWRLGLVILGLSPFMLAAGALEAKMQTGYTGDIEEAYKQSSALVSESVTNYRTIMSFANEELIMKYYSQTLNAPFKSGIKRSHVSGILFGYSQFSQWLVYGLAFFLAAVFLENDLLSGPDDMFKAIYCLLFGAYGAGQAQSFAPDIVKAMASSHSVYRILDEPTTCDPMSEEGEVIPNKAQGKIEFRNVWFKYPTRSDWIFKGVSFTIKPGQSVALVGQSGCGKSTIIQLILRFYEIQKGSILLDGHDIRDLNLRSLRSQMALVQQEPVLFDATISENIAYGRPDASQEEVRNAAKAANALEFIESGVDGFNRKVGTRGSQLSGGQKQRVAIARALVKEPSILLLDEATSALDKESEAIVQQALDEVMKNYTSIVIAHRLSTIEHVDCLYVLENGVIAEEGDYHTLLNKKDGVFHKIAVGQY